VKKRKELLQIFQDRVIVLDGATGTELQARTMPEGVCPELWCLDNEPCIRSVHEDYIKAGSDIIYTCTFGANRFKLSEYGASTIEEINTALACIAKKAAGDNCLVAGDIGPTGRFIEPFGEVAFDEAVEVFKEQARGLLKGGADLIVIETQLDIQEARAALIAVKELSDIFTMVSMTYESSGRTLGGTDPVSALITLQALGADAVGCNCSTGPEGMLPLVRSMQPYATVPLVAKPNAGLPKLREGKTYFDMQPDQFCAFAEDFISSGVRLIGGCCGTTPAHIQALKRSISNLTAREPAMKAVSALSSAQKTVFFQKDSPLAIIGERINPTGKKDLQEELLHGKTGIVKRYAKEQAHSGADVLDVNVGMPGIDETETIRTVVKDLAVSTSAPLSIDSSVPEAIEAALRVYPGRALINSISGEENKLDQLMKIAKKYGAMFILLPIGGKKLPKTAPERIAVIEDIFSAARGFGLSREDIIVDALTFAVSADQAAAMETLRTIRWCANDFGCMSVLGLSNVSFGLPQRSWINSAFVAMAISEGLTHAIANPLSTEFMNIKRASDVLMCRDREAKHYIAHFAGPKEGLVSPGTSGLKAKPSLSSGEKVYTGIVEGSRGDIVSLIEEALRENLSPHTIVNTYMVPAIREVGDLYEKKVYFLPQLISSAETMKKGFEHLEPLIKKDDLLSSKKGKILLATVKGDIHDIGKNIVALMLKNQGFEVFDLGKDVPHEDIIDAARQHQVDIVGLSALMTTTMVNMKEVIDLSRKAGLACRFMVGGAVVTGSFAQSIGAHYAKDGVEAVKLAESLMS